MLRASGSGKLLLSSYGAIHEFNLKAGEEARFLASLPALSHD
jgi:uncharacterized protein (AIM24 family)